jgi:hypothetical protein
MRYLRFLPSPLNAEAPPDQSSGPNQAFSPENGVVSTLSASALRDGGLGPITASDAAYSPPKSYPAIRYRLARPRAGEVAGD